MPVLSETLISARRIGRRSLVSVMQLIRKFLCSGWQINHELLRARIAFAGYGVFHALRLHTHREDMPTIVARRFGYIETQKVLAFQILFDGLKDGGQIVFFRHECCPCVADEEVFTSSFLSEVFEAFTWTPDFESSITWLEERQVNHVKRDTSLQCCIDNAVSARSAARVEAVAYQHDDATLGANRRQIVKHRDCTCRSVEDCSLSVRCGSEFECSPRRVKIFCEWSDE